MTENKSIWLFLTRPKFDLVTVKSGSFCVFSYEGISLEKVSRRKNPSQLPIKVILAIWSLFICNNVSPGQNTPTNNAVAVFKSYLEKQPAVRHIKFLYREAKESKDGKTVFLPDDFKVASGGWYEGGFYYRQLDGPNASEDPNSKGASERLFVGRDGSNYWQINGVNVTQTTAQNGPADNTNAMIRTALFYESVLAKAICLGIDNIAPGSARWTNNQFVADYNGPKLASDLMFQVGGVKRVVKFDETQHVFGTLDSSNELSLRLQISEFDPLFRPCFISYEHSGTNKLAMDLPDIITVQVKTPAGLVTASELIITALEFADDANKPNFNAAGFVDPQYLSINTWSNGQLYRTLKNGSLKRVPSFAEREQTGVPTLKNQSWEKRYLIWFLLGAAALVFIILRLKVTNRKTQ